MRFGFHSVLGEVQWQERELGPFPDQQVEQTVNIMRRNTRQDSECPEFRVWAAGVCGSGSAWEKVERAFEHTKGVIRFQRDEETGAELQDAMGKAVPADTIEVIVRPLDVKRYVEQGKAVGDCDDFSSYLAALLRAQGIKTAFVTLAADQEAPGQYSHVYVAAYVEGERVSLDASHGPYVGWEAPNKYGKLCEWPVDGVGSGDFGGLVLLAAAGYGAYLIGSGRWREVLS